MLSAHRHAHGGAAGGVWDMVSNAATGAWDFLTGGEDNNKPVGGALGLTPIGMGINAATGIGEWLSGGNEKNDPYKRIEKATIVSTIVIPFCFFMMDYPQVHSYRYLPESSKKYLHS